MPIAVTGSIATDHLMTFPGRFADQLLADRLSHVSLSFLVDTLDIRPGGVGANIAYGLALLGQRPVLVGAAGADFGPYGAELAAAGVELAFVRTSPTRHTARFLCTTDQDGNQLASFYPGAMSEAASIDIADVVRRLGGVNGVDLLHVGADTPEAMLRHTAAARGLGLPFAADPSQQLALLDGPRIRELVSGARLLFTNEYEHALLLGKTGWSGQEVLDRVGTWVTTLGEKGSRIAVSGEPPVEVAALPSRLPADPTGVGDAFRAGFLAATVSGLGPADAARVGSALATAALESVGPRTYGIDRGSLLSRITAAYGAGSGAAHFLAALPRPAAR